MFTSHSYNALTSGLIGANRSWAISERTATSLLYANRFRGRYLLKCLVMLKSILRMKSYASAFEQEGQICDSGTFNCTIRPRAPIPKQVLHVGRPHFLQIPPRAVSNSLPQLWHFQGII